jgi:hypothetical protein
LWDATQATEYGRSMSLIRDMRDAQACGVGLTAGHHVHVAARDYHTGRGFTPNALVSLYSVFAHCEDLLYRLAAAGWENHRCESNGDYSAPMLKVSPGMRRSPRSVGNAIGNERYQGLNVTPYLGAIQSCRCGAFRFGEWDACECPDNRATIEWRLFNAAVSPRKVRAYIAIAANLTSYAALVDSRATSSLDEHPFTGCNTVDTEALRKQLDYLTSRPGFTSRDRTDIEWLASISPGMRGVVTNSLRPLVHV